MQDFAFYFPWGWKHIISWGALDHQLFIAALSAIYVLTDWRQVLILVTAFTIGHSLTLALSVYGIIPDKSNWIEFLIPCTIIATAISNLFQKKFTPKSIRINYFLALFFGLIHGMGFASAIRITLATGQNIGWGLLGFNVGLEAGQIVIVIILLVLSQIIRTVLKTNRREWVIFLSAAVFSLAVEMAIQRFPFTS